MMKKKQVNTEISIGLSEEQKKRLLLGAKKIKTLNPYSVSRFIGDIVDLLSDDPNLMSIIVINVNAKKYTKKE